MCIITTYSLFKQYLAIDQDGKQSTAIPINITAPSNYVPTNDYNLDTTGNTNFSRKPGNILRTFS